MTTKKILSIVLPVFNEEKNIAHVCEGIGQEMKKYEEKYEYEIVLVNDGSRDMSWGIISTLCDQNNHIHGINFSRNFWQQAALEAGLNEAHGDAVITMDADGQHPATLIPELVREWENGFFIVNTKRLSTQKIHLFKKISSNIFYRLFNTLAGYRLEPASSDFRLLDRTVVDFLNTLQESPKFYRGILAWTWYKTAVVAFHAGKREGGTSGYSLQRMYELALLGITSCSLKPLKIIILFGAFIAASASFLCCIAVYLKLVHSDYFSSSALWWSFMLANTGVIIVILGILWIYNAHIIATLHERPTFIIKERK